MAQQSNNHSFYKEAKKSFYGSEGFSKEKGWKLTKKFSKWGLYGFLTITTLWGCVNEFIIKTGDQIGTGVEFYSNSNEVVPNMFASETEMAWEAKGKQEEAIDNNNIEEWEGTELKPFDMVTFNPYYLVGDDEEHVDNFNTPVVSIQDANLPNGGQITETSNSLAKYNLQQLEENKVDTTDNGEKDSIYFHPSSFPDNLADEVPEGESSSDYVTTWSTFYVDRLEAGQLKDPNGVLLGDEYDKDEEIFINESASTNKYFNVKTSIIKDDEGNETGGTETTITPKLGWYAMPSNIKGRNPKTADWQIVADPTVASVSMLQPDFVKDEDDKLTSEVEKKVSLEEVNVFATNTAINITNEIAFYVGKEVTVDNTIGDFLGLTEDYEIPMMQIQQINGKSYNEFYQLVADESDLQDMTISDIAINSTWSYMQQYTEDENGELDPNKFAEYYDAITINDIKIIENDYSADYSTLLTSTSESGKNSVTSGQTYSISTVSSKEPTIPTYDALYTMQNLRPNDWDKDKKELRKSSKLNEIYVDPLAQVAGWGLLDESGNLRIVSDPEFTSEYYIIQQVYDDPDASFYGDSKKKEYIYDNDDYKGNYYGDLSEDQYYEALIPIFAMQRTGDWASSQDSSVTSAPSSTSSYVYKEGENKGKPKDIELNFDEMMNSSYAKEAYKAYYESTLNTKIYKDDDTSITKGIQQQQYEIAYAVSIEGMNANTAIGSKTPDYKDDPDEKINGTATPLDWTADPINKTSLDSSLYNSQSKGIDEGNTSRGIFAGWSDWGWAWNIKFGPLYGVFLFPISQIALFVQHTIFPFRIFGAWGVLLGVFFIVFFLRGVGSLMSFKSTSNQQKMQEVQAEVAKINAKYEKYGDNKQMKQRKQQEVMALYRKKEINPLGSFGTIFITMPIFISMWILISAVPVYKVAAIGGFSFSVSALSGIFTSLCLLYIMVGVSVGMMQGISAKLPGWLSQKRKGVKQVTEAEKKAQKKQNKTQNIMVGVFIVIGLTVPVLLAFYWISSAVFTICLELGRHWYQVKKGKKVKVEK